MIRQRTDKGTGVQFAVGSGLTDAEREQPPAIGTTITFRYPTFVRMRTDIALTA